MTYNYFIFNEFIFPKENHTYFIDNIYYQTAPLNQNLLISGQSVDGQINNLRKIQFEIIGEAAQTVNVKYTGETYNGLEITEEITITDGIPVTTENFYRLNKSLFITEPSENFTLKVGFADGFTSLLQCNGSKTAHYVLIDTPNEANVSVYGIFNPYIDPVGSFLNDDRFTLSNTLENITSTMTRPEYVLYPFGFATAYIEPGATSDVKYQVGMQTLL